MSSSLHADQEAYSKATLGTWLYILSDFLFFGVLFAVYAFFQDLKLANELYRLNYTFYATLLFLISSASAGLAGAYLHRRNRAYTLVCFLCAFFFGACFLTIECSNLVTIFNKGYSWESSAFFSAYFTLIITHGLHVAFCLFWMIVLLFPLFFQEIRPRDVRRLTCFRMFWQFLNIVWIFIFTIVYLMGVEGIYV